MAEGYRGIYNSPDTVIIPDVPGVNPSAEEALWNPGGGESWYMPIVPCKKGFKSVTLYNPEACKVERLLKDKGYWEGGSISSIFTPTLGERSKSIGSGTLSAVNDPSFKNTIRGLDAWSKRPLSLSVVGGTAAALSPGEARAFVPVQDYRARGIPADEYPWPADSPGYVNREPGPGSPLADMAAEPGESHK